MTINWYVWYDYGMDYHDEQDGLERDAGWVRPERPSPWPVALQVIGSIVLLAWLVLFLGFLVIALL